MPCSAFFKYVLYLINVFVHPHLRSCRALIGLIYFSIIQRLEYCRVLIKRSNCVAVVGDNRQHPRNICGSGIRLPASLCQIGLLPFSNSIAGITSSGTTKSNSIEQGILQKLWSLACAHGREYLSYALSPLKSSAESSHRSVREAKASC